MGACQADCEKQFRPGKNETEDPGSYQTGYPVTGLDELDEDVLVFHAGTKLDDAGQVVTSGGRVLTVVAGGNTLNDAREKVYNNIPRIHFEGAQYRNDIAVIKGWP